VSVGLRAKAPKQSRTVATVVTEDFLIGYRNQIPFLLWDENALFGPRVSPNLVEDLLACRSRSEHNFLGFNCAGGEAGDQLTLHDREKNNCRNNCKDGARGDESPPHLKAAHKRLEADRQSLRLVAL
jgi:hypothetical protein